jgi:hypothetical protein
MRPFVIAALAVVACRIPDEQFPITDAAGPPNDGAQIVPDGMPPQGPCDLTKPFSVINDVPGLGAIKSVARFSADELTAYFAMGLDGTPTGDPAQINRATRASATDTFSAPKPIAVLNGSDGESTPVLSPDGSTIYYVWGEPPNHTANQRVLFSSARGSNGAFQAGSAIPGLDGSGEDDYPSVDSEGDLWFGSKRGTDPVVSIYHAPNVGGSFGQPMAVSELNSVADGNYYPVLTPDRTQIFISRMGSVSASFTIYTATRGSASGPFSVPSKVLEIDHDPTVDYRSAWISPDGCRLYIGSGTRGGIKMSVASRPSL